VGWLARRPLQCGALFRTAPITLATPRDFDVSPYFEVIKLHLCEEVGFDYRKIRWVEDQAS
jgi:hypothetical protein